MATEKVVLISGASSGLGKACADWLSKLGHRVYGGSRSAGKIPKDASFNILGMDVTEDASVNTAVQSVIEKEGRIDVVLCNAGNGIAGSVEDTTIEEAKTQFETNFFGAMRVVKAVLPHMRKRGSGLILFTGSIAGRAAVPYQALYSSSKSALEGLVEALRMEVAHFGIRCAIIEPGDFKTGFTHARRVVNGASDSVYSSRFVRTLSVMEKDEACGSDPLVFAKLVARLTTKTNIRVRYTVGPVFERFAAGIKRILPSRLFELFFSLYYKA